MFQPPPDPNLFDYATSELSQDAALCYFLAYGAPRYSGGTQAPKHDFARALLEKMFEICGKAFPDKIKNIDVIKQHHIKGKSLDILVRVNHMYIAIEDKRQAQDHADQLLSYSEVHKDLGVPAEDVLLMYVQTGNQANVRNIENAKFKLMSRSMLLSLFETEIGTIARKESKIHNDFYLHFRKLEDQYRDFEVIDITQWDIPAQVGFVEALSAKHHGHWEPSGGGGGSFRAYRGPAVQIGSASAYIQVEVSNKNQPEIHLRFKVDVPPVSSRDEYDTVWKQWYERMNSAVTKSQTGLSVKKSRRKPPKSFDNQTIKPHSLLILNINDARDNWTTSRIFPSMDSTRRLMLADTVATLKKCQTILELL